MRKRNAWASAIHSRFQFFNFKLILTQTIKVHQLWGKLEWKELVPNWLTPHFQATLHQHHQVAILSGENKTIQPWVWEIDLNGLSKTNQRVNLPDFFKQSAIVRAERSVAGMPANDPLNVPKGVRDMATITGVYFTNQIWSNSNLNDPPPPLLSFTTCTYILWSCGIWSSLLRCCLLHTILLIVMDILMNVGSIDVLTSTSNSIVSSLCGGDGTRQHRLVCICLLFVVCCL